MLGADRTDTGVTVHRFGQEAEPVVQIDDYSGMADELLARGRSATYQPGGAMYPGLRSLWQPDYLDRQGALMVQVMQQVFGVQEGVKVESCAFSMVCTPAGELTPPQRIPHYDDTGGEVLAIMHYLLGPETGGTAFYRHRRTGFETITPQREAAFSAAVAKDEREYGPPADGYYYGDTDRYEKTGEIEARPDRLIVYRGRLLHSGVIPQPHALTVDPAEGRLTINMFLIAR